MDSVNREFLKAMSKDGNVDIELMYSEKGKPLYLIDGYKFYFQKELSNKVGRWACCLRDCNSYIKMNMETKQIVKMAHEHKHPKPDPSGLYRQRLNNTYKFRIAEEISRRQLLKEIGKNKEPIRMDPKIRDPLAPPDNDFLSDESPAIDHDHTLFGNLIHENQIDGLGSRLHVIKTEDLEDDIEVHEISHQNEDDCKPVITLAKLPLSSHSVSKRWRMREAVKKRRLAKARRGEDEFTTFGKHVANQLRKLDETECADAQEQIQSVLSQARMRSIQRFNSNSPQLIPSWAN